jgi:hypothetical protein
MAVAVWEIEDEEVVLGGRAADRVARLLRSRSMSSVGRAMRT